MEVQSLSDAQDDDFYCTYEEILEQEELDRLQNEFQPRLTKSCYLDHAGATLYAKSQIDAFSSELESTLWSNPHSRNPSSSITTDAIDCVRHRVLEHFGTTGEEYSVIFTSGATSALKLLAESFRFNGGTFAYLEESHTSVVGMREVVGSGAIKKQLEARRRHNPKVYHRESEFTSSGSSPCPKVYCLAKATMETLMDTECGSRCSGRERSSSSNNGNKSVNQVPTMEARTTMRRDELLLEDGEEENEEEEESELRKGNGLVVYPAQCNFSGYKYPLDWLVKVQHGHLDEINEIDHFYIQPEHVAQLIVNHEAEQCLCKQCPNLDSEWLCEQESPQERRRKENETDSSDATLPGESFHIKNKQTENGTSTTGRIQEEEDGDVERRRSIPHLKQVAAIPTCNCVVQDKEEGKARRRTGNRVRGKRKLNWYVVLDAASFVATSRLDLSQHPADFIAISFYKMFGFPTGLGALLVRKESSHLLEKEYFGGGTVNIQLPWRMFHAKRDRLEERFEDGTISFLSILALRHGFRALESLGTSMETITVRTFRLARYLYQSLVGMKYPNGRPVAIIYADTKYESTKTQGPVVTFNLLRESGEVIGYSEMEQMAYLQGVNLRYGCFCNVGACRRHLGLQPEDVLKQYEAGHVCGDMRDVIDGRPTGAIRASMGYMTTRADVDLLLRLIHTCWILPSQNLRKWKEKGGGGEEVGREEEQVLEETGPRWRDRQVGSIQEEAAVRPKHRRGKGSPGKVSRIFVYPVKSCAPFQVTKMWAIGSRGLLYDREWLIVNSTGVPLTQKREPRLCQLQPSIDVSNRRLVLSFHGFPDAAVPLERSEDKEEESVKADMCTSKVCGDVISGVDCGNDIAEWLSSVFQRPGLRLIRMKGDHSRKSRKTMEDVSLANTSQYLLICTSTVRLLAMQLLRKNPDWPTDQENSSFKNLGNGTSQRLENESKAEVGDRHENNNRKDWTEQQKQCNGQSSLNGNIPRQNMKVVQEIDKTRLSYDTVGIPDVNGSSVGPSEDSKSRETMQQLNQVVENLIWRFRPNLVISDGNESEALDGSEEESLVPYEEESWENIRLGNIPFKSGGPCARCATICTDQKTGQRGPEPFLTLSASRKGNPNFGIHLYRRKDSTAKASLQVRDDESSLNIRRVTPAPPKVGPTSLTASSSPAASREQLSVIHIGDPLYVESYCQTESNGEVGGESTTGKSEKCQDHNGEALSGVANRNLIDSID